MHLDRQNKSSYKFNAYLMIEPLRFFVEWKDDGVLWVNEKGD